MKLRVTIIAALAATIAVHHTAPAAAATPVLIEQTQAQLLPAAALPAAWRMDDRAPFQTGYEHYTRTVGCGWRHPHYVAKCLSLKQSPPPAGSTAIYDPEKWSLTSLSEKADWCAGMRLAAQLTTAAGANLVISVPEMRSQANVECATRNARQIIFQIQPHEADPAAYMHLLEQATSWARAIRPGERVIFVVSTASRYGATSASLTADYTMAEAYLGGFAPCWLNVIPENGDPAAGVSLAESFLTSIAAPI